MHLVCPACGTTNRVPDPKLHDQPVCGKCGASLMATAPVALDDTTLAKFVARTELPVLVDFWAEWCGPCKMIAPILEDVAKDYAGRLTVAKIDIDSNPAAPAKYGIRGIPTLILFKAGQVAAQKVGALSKSQLTAFIDSHL